MGLFGNKNKVHTSDLILFEEMTDDDQRAAELVEELINDHPLVINFETLIDNPKACNKFVAFLSGAAFALDGRTLKIKKYIYLFAKNSHFDDGTLLEFVNQYTENDNL